ncbi:MAG: aldehyde dehydrogenase family protein [Alysiella sp.]|uniref:aldehyde dehydrogenase family protein n=1 Tax=Alysiella sp. TaxID=1872483 RepID=UPI0026DD6795|nr:aldehyde dehydrogenase family protein [Alysiella sp.]MDO4434517.1 aldehyde dehydrogenase family protein [Alysiella sp.]
MNTAFHSTHVLSGITLYTRPADSWDTLNTQIGCLKQQQSHFTALHITERTAKLLAFAERLTANKARLANMICEEVGRCLRECEAELDKSVELIRYYAKLAPEFLANKTIATQASLSGVSFAPLGVVLAVMPWNYPVWQIIRFAVPALCAGNACWVKPAPSVARVTTALFDLVGQDLPLQAAWLAHQDMENAIAACDALAFTGSTQTGRHLAALAGKHIKKCVLELGGSNAFVVLPDADLVQAAKDACYSRFRDAGQSCNAAKRLIVCDAIADEFIALFLNEVAKLKTGNPVLPETTLAPMHRTDLREKLHQQVLDAQQNGAILLCGGKLPESSEHNMACFYPATVLDNLNPACKMWHEEVFGPAIGIVRVADENAAIIAANATPFGLGASIYTQNMKQAQYMARQLQVGSVFINRHTSSDLRLPFGGVKDSGFGRELSEFGLYEFVNVKTYWQK